MSAPLRFPRILTQGLAFSFGIVTVALCARALAVLNHDADLVKTSGLPGAALHADDIVNASSALAAAGAVTAVACVVFSLQLLLKPAENWTTFSIPALGFCSLFSLATSIAVTVIGMGKATISLPFPLPEAVINKLVKARGLSLKYLDTSLVEGFVVVEWFLWLSVTIALVLEFMASRRTTKAVFGTNRADPLADEKLSDEQRSF